MLRSPLSRQQAYGSESDITSIKDSKTSTEVQPNSDSRKKRRLRNQPHEDILVKDDFEIFKKEIKDMLCDWKKEQDATFHKLSQDISEVKRQNLEIQRINIEMEKSLNFLSNEYEDIKRKLQTTETLCMEQQKIITTLSDRMEDFERQANSSQIEIRNIPHTMSESKENLKSTVCSLMNTINATVSNTDIYDTYRFSNKENNKKTVIVKLTTPLIKENIIKSFKNYNKNNSTSLNTSCLGYKDNVQKIFISEMLSKKAKRLFFLARETAKSCNYSYCWTAHGRVFLRKTEGAPQVLVKSEQQLELIKKAII